MILFAQANGQLLLKVVHDLLILKAWVQNKFFSD